MSEDLEALADLIIEAVECQPPHKRRAHVVAELAEHDKRVRTEALYGIRHVRYDEKLGWPEQNPADLADPSISWHFEGGQMVPPTPVGPATWGRELPTRPARPKRIVSRWRSW